jgi:ribonucleoside-diphosphate reductase alpha chain
MTTLEELKKNNEAPEWMDDAGFKTLSNGYLLDNETPRGMYKRVARAAASYYKDNSSWEERFFNAMWSNWLCISSPIAANFGTDRGLPISCNSIHVDDSLDSIYQKQHELAMLSKNGAGVGIYMGDIRGRGAPIKGNGKSEGIIPFAKCYDSTTIAVNQGCYDEDTEILSEVGWVPFSYLKNNPELKVAQCDDLGSLSFSNFNNYIEYEVKEDLYRISGKSSAVDLLITGNHRVAIERRKRVSNKRNSFGKFLNNEKKLTGKLEILLAENLSTHRDMNFWVSARSCSGELETLSYEERFKIAYQADGSTKAISNGSISGNSIYAFRFKKERKIKRLQNILNNLQWKYTTNVQKDGSTSILARVPLQVNLSKKLVDMFDIKRFSKSYADQFIEEVSNWDGTVTDVGSISYSCIIKDNVDFVQSVAFMSGKMSTSKLFANREGNRVDLYSIFICDRDKVGGENLTVTKQYYEGKVYCVSVKSGLLVVRRNGKPVICGNSTRRGASAIYLPIDHSDAEEFINVRKPVGDINRRCLNLNHALCISDKWMIEMLNGDISKRKTWEQVLEARVATGEPYLFFSDNVNKKNPKWYKDKQFQVVTSNICSEIVLFTDPSHTFVCCLSSLNLARWDEWKDTDLATISTYFLDAVLEEYIEKASVIKGFENSVRSAIKGRALGLGVLGWHTLLQNRSLPFNSFEAMMLNSQIFKSIRNGADKATRELAIEKGEPEWCKGYGIRNTHLMAVAPTVSNSTISGGVSAGIEPLVSNVYAQKSAKGTFIRRNPSLEKVLEAIGKNDNDTWKSINENNGSVQHLKFLDEHTKNVFLTAREINQHSIVTQAVQRQAFVDQAQSVNLFFAANSDPKYIHEVHINAWQNGLKTLYYLRSEGVIKGDLASRSKDECVACEG